MVLVDTGAGLVLIDTGPQEAVPHVLASIRALGFDPKRIRWILSTHEHFDHVGGLAAMQRETGADIVSGPFIGDAPRSGRPFLDDPQAAELAEKPMEPVKVTRTLRDNGSVFTSDPRFTAHATPTHSPGSTSWTWRSCDQDGCKTIAYADSNSTISSDGYRFSDNPRRIKQARYGLKRIAALPCDIMLTPHPSGSNLLERLSGREALVDAGACKAYAESGMKRPISGWTRKARRSELEADRLAPRAVIEAALLAHEDALDWDPEIVLSGSEIAEDKPEDWQLEAWLGRKPGKADKAAIAALFPDKAPRLIEEKLPDIDWLTHSRGWSRSAPGGFMSTRPSIRRWPSRACATSPFPPARPSAPASTPPLPGAWKCWTP